MAYKKTRKSRVEEVTPADDDARNRAGVYLVVGAHHASRAATLCA
jgi:hypothetical protein